MIRFRPALAWAVAACFACGDGTESVATDAGADGGSTTIAEPAAPSPPSPAPCAEGWALDGDEDGDRCVPWPVDVAPCAPEETRFPGSNRCAPLGSTCPSGAFPDDAADVGTRFVDPSAAEGGDGSLAAPFARLADALATSASGDVVLLARGDHEADVTVPAGVTVRGACVSSTRLVVGVDAAAAIRAGGAGVRVVNLTIAGSGAVVGPDAADLSLEDVVVEDAAGDAVFVSGEGSLTARRVVVRGGGADGSAGIATADAPIELAEVQIAARAGDGIGARGAGALATLTNVHVIDVGASGIVADDGAQVEAEGVLVERAGTEGLLADGGAIVSGSSVTMRDTAGGGDEPPGDGMRVRGAARLSLRSVHLERHPAAALRVESGAEIVLEDVVITDIPGAGMLIIAARGTLRRGTIARTRVIAAGAFAGELTLEDVVVTDTTLDTNIWASSAVGVANGASALLSRVRLVRNVDFAIRAQNPGTRVDATDLVVIDGASLPTDGRSGRAVDVSLGAEATLTRARFERNREIAIAAWEPGTRITMADVRVLDTLERACAADTCAGFGQGVSLGAYRGAEIAAQRFEIAGSALAGIQIAREGAVDLAGGTVAGHPIAVNIQVPEYDVSRLTRAVVYRDNEVQLDATSLPLPDDPLTGE